jgi:alpha-glucoside transport system substrate-binding protein
MKRLLVTAVLLAPLLALGAEMPAKIGGKVTVLGVWGGTELDTFNKMVKPFEERTGVKVEFEATRDLDAVLTTRVAAGSPPDLAVLPSPGKMADLSRQGKLVDLGSVLDLGAMKKSYAQGWLDLGSVDGKLVGIFPKADLKGLIWYVPKALQAAGLSASPRTFEDLMAEANAASGKGVTPFAIGIESGAASGWVGTDWLENIFLKTYGPAKYKEWYEGKLAWTSPEVRSVFQTWGKIVGNPKLCYGGSQYVLSTNFGNAYAPLFEKPPKAYFHFQATFIQGFIAKQFPDLKAGEDFSFFAMPPVKAAYARSAEIAGDLVGMFRKTPQSSAFLQYLTTAEAQGYWVKGGNGLSPNRQVALTDYPNALSKAAAQILTSAELTVFDASDMMPSKMNTAFWAGVVSFVSNPADLDGVLEDLEAVRADAYGKM